MIGQAAEEAGVPIGEAKTWLEGQRELLAYDDDGLRILAAEALVEGLEALKRIARENDGRQSRSGESGYKYDDITAAKALVDTALKIRGMARGAKKDQDKTPGPLDLFDLATNWQFTKKD